MQCVRAWIVLEGSIRIDTCHCGYTTIVTNGDTNTNTTITTTTTTATNNDDDDDDNNDNNNNNNNKESRPVVTYVFLLYPFLEHHFHV